MVLGSGAERGLPTWTIDFSFAIRDERAGTLFYEQWFCSEGGSAYNYFANSHSDDELLDSDELGKFFRRARAQRACSAARSP